VSDFFSDKNVTLAKQDLYASRFLGVILDFLGW
jgi:hypothetical protein